MTYKVTVTNNNFRVKINKPNNYKVTYPTGGSSNMPKKLEELMDVEITGNLDKYVLMYDAVSGKWKDVNPNEVLSAASNTETTQPGLPVDFVNTLDVDLDNKIDLDAGAF